VSGAGDRDDPAPAGRFIAVIVVEILVLFGLWLMGRQFS
jgi:hypothetical protein